MLRDSSPQFREAASNAERRRLALLLRAAIVRGDFPDGRLPREPELMRDYGVSRTVVRDVLLQLKETGVVTRTHGVGTQADIGSVFGLYEFHGVDVIPEQSTYPRVIDRKVIGTPPVAAERMPDCGPRVLRVEYIAAPANYASAVSTNYFVLPKAEALETAPFGHNIYQFLHNGGLRLSSSEFLIGAMLADESVGQRLSVIAGSPLLSLEQVMYDEDGVPLCFSTVALRADRVAFFSRVGRSDGGDALRPVNESPVQDLGFS
ncbi:GntR family transcriptional regulator [Microbacterium sp. SSM24]|uniref:GntR family transcriptional regulator n=1 Tax=Microbacterium sp. SSM24 TaxID=2991714 RepID=UPI0022265F95|nr:GntR family transcriptional regulator [Microbacterium sp. SSM24]MCW3494663.1 GntR family transcriptional regulator [Microbacterium sp. SSM24]